MVAHVGCCQWRGGGGVLLAFEHQLYLQVTQCSCYIILSGVLQGLSQKFGQGGSGCAQSPRYYGAVTCRCSVQLEPIGSTSNTQRPPPLDQPLLPFATSNFFWDLQIKIPTKHKVYFNTQAAPSQLASQRKSPNTVKRMNAYFHQFLALIL